VILKANLDWKNASNGLIKISCGQSILAVVAFSINTLLLLLLSLISTSLKIRLSFLIYRTNYRYADDRDDPDILLSTADRWYFYLLNILSWRAPPFPQEGNFDPENPAQKKVVHQVRTVWNKYFSRFELELNLKGMFWIWWDLYLFGNLDPDPSFFAEAVICLPFINNEIHNNTCEVLNSVGDPDPNPNPNPNPKGSERFEGSESKSESE